MELRFKTHDNQIIVIESENHGYIKMIVLDKEGVSRRSEVVMTEEDLYNLRRGLDMFS